MSLIERLISLRKANRFTQDSLAEKMGVSRQAVSRWETGEATPTMGNLTALSQLYGVSLSYLLDGKECFKTCPQSERCQQPQPAPSPEPEAAPDAKAEPTPPPTPEAECEPDPIPERKPEPQPESEATPEPVSEPEQKPQEARRKLHWLPWAVAVGFALLSLVLALLLVQAKSQNSPPVRREVIPMGELPTDSVTPLEETFTFYS